MLKFSHKLLLPLVLTTSFIAQASQQEQSKEEIQKQVAVLQQKFKGMERAHLLSYRKLYFEGGLPTLKADNWILIKKIKNALTWIATFEELETLFRAEHALAMLNQTEVEKNNTLIEKTKNSLHQKLSQISKIVQKAVTTDPNDDQKLHALQLTRFHNIRLARLFNAWLINAFLTKSIDDNFSYILPYGSESIRNQNAHRRYLQESFPQDPEIVQLQHLINLTTAFLTSIQKKRLYYQNFPRLTTLAADAVNYYSYPQLTEQ